MAISAAERADAWGAPPAGESGGRCTPLVAALVLGPALLFGGLGFLFWGWTGLLPGVLALVVGLLIVRTAASALSGDLGPRPATDPRLLNIVSGLSADIGREPPPTFIVSGRGINALVFWHGGRPALGLTEELTSGLARTEIEAVVAHCLVRLDHSVGGLDRSALTLGGTFAACGRGVALADDVRAVALTRYPPALAKAIEKSSPASGRFSYLWFAADDRSHATREARLEALQDL